MNSFSPKKRFTFSPFLFPKNLLAASSSQTLETRVPRFFLFRLRSVKTSPIDARNFLGLFVFFFRLFPLRDEQLGTLRKKTAKTPSGIYHDVAVTAELFMQAGIHVYYLSALYLLLIQADFLPSGMAVTSWYE